MLKAHIVLDRHHVTCDSEEEEYAPDIAEERMTDAISGLIAVIGGECSQRALGDLWADDGRSLNPWLEILTEDADESTILGLGGRAEVLEVLCYEPASNGLGWRPSEQTGARLRDQLGDL